MKKIKWSLSEREKEIISKLGNGKEIENAK